MNSAVVCKVEAAKDIIRNLTMGYLHHRHNTPDDTCFALKYNLVHKFSLLSSYDTDVIPPYLPTWKAHSDMFRFIVGANKCPLKTLYLRIPYDPNF